MQPMEIVMHENVMPWMMDVMLDFLLDETEITTNAEEIVKDAVELSRTKHLESMRKEQERRNNIILEKEKKIQEKE